nr:alpha/beta fold hydrolase [Azospirillum sp. A1-3]
MFAMVLPSLVQPPQRDPLLVLSGGPGQAGSDSVAFAATMPARLRERHDLILFDQRGTGLSQPSLRCPAIDPMRFWYGGLTAQDVRGCLDPLRTAGYRLEAFDTRQSAFDLIALRRALGLERWSVLATSYGAVLAHTLAQLDGDAVQSQVLNSPSTPTASWLDPERFSAIERVFRLVADDCAAQPDCARAFPRLRGAVPHIAKALDETPLLVHARDRSGGPDQVRRFAWPEVAGALTFRLGAGDRAAVPAIIDYLDRVSSGRQKADERVLADILMPPQYWQMFDTLAYGLNLVIGCRETRSHIDPASARAAAAGHYPYVVPDAVEVDYDVACPTLELEPVDKAFYQPARPDIPTLILTGSYDTLVPTDSADVMAGRLRAARVVRFRGLGHDVLASSPCAAALAAHFIDDPTGEVPQTCAERFLPPSFTVTQIGR